MRALLLSALLAALPSAARAEHVALLPATGSNVDEAHLAASTDVLRAYLERTGRFQVTTVASPMPAGTEAGALEAGAAARAAAADLAVTLRISRLGSSALVRLGAYRPDGALAHADELVAGGPDDLDKVLRRLADGLAAGRPARLLAEVDTVTRKEADPYLKFESTNTFGIRLGAASVMNRASGASSASVAGGGLFWLYDARSFLADVTLELLSGEEDTSFAIGIGAYYPFARGNGTPFVGGGVSYAWVDHGGDGSSGLALRVGGGYLLGRLSNVQLRVDGGWAVNTFGEPTTSGSTETHAAHGPYVAVGLGF